MLGRVTQVRAVRAMLIALMGFSRLALGQSDTSQAGPPHGLARTLRFCGPAHCGTLTWHNQQYAAVYDDGNGTSVYTFERFSPDNVKIARVDSNGSRAELTGKLSAQGNRIDGAIRWLSGGSGTFTFSLTWDPSQDSVAAPKVSAPSVAADHPASSAGTKPTPSPPSVMHYCALNCWTLELEGDHYVASTRYSWNPPDYRSVWTVESFTRDSVVLHRRDTPGTLDARVSGRMSPEENSLEGLTIDGTPYPDFQLSWGTALDRTPGNNEERDRRHASAAVDSAPRAATPAVQEPPLPMPVFLKDETLNYELNGEWAVNFPASWPRHPPLTGIAVAKGNDFQLVAANPNLFYPLGQNFFYGHFTDRRHLEGKWMDAPAHAGDGYRGYAWTDAKIEILDADHMESGTGVALKRSSADMGANHLCDPVAYAHLDAAHTFDYADKSAELKNYGNAACWAYVSGSQGHSEAQLSLGLLLRFGLGVQKDEKLAFQWIQRSANSGWVMAERALADCYSTGIGVGKNETQARFWREKASAATPQMGQIAREQQASAAFFERFASLLSGRDMDVQERAAELTDCPGPGMCRTSPKEAMARAQAEKGAAEYMYDLMNSGSLPPMPESR